MFVSSEVQDKSLLMKSIQYTQECINEIRSISKRLSAPNLSDISFQDSIKELVNSINAAKLLKIQLCLQGIEQATISEELHIAIYRIVQEGLTNILKYSKADRASIEMRVSGANLIVKIWDNGMGFDVQAKRTGIGITNMKTRAEHMNASFTIDSAPGKGCTIEIIFPFDEARTDM
jgi:signal transduction histidine kinase